MKHKIVFKSPSRHVPSQKTPDGAFCGNGDIAVIWSGSPDKLRIYISKADFWKSTEGDRADGGIGPVAVLDFKMPTLFDASHCVVQDIDNAEITAKFENSCSTLDMKATVLAQTNIIYIEMSVSGIRLTNSVELKTFDDNGAEVEYGNSNGVQWVRRGWHGEDCVFPTDGIVAMKQLRPIVSEEKRTYRYVIGVMTNHDSAAYRTLLLKKIALFDENDLMYEIENHKKWWHDFWGKSGVKLPWKDIELMWYMGQYVMACCSRNRNFAPGLYGNLITSDKMMWHSDYHLNYNYQAPFYALTSSNHTELMDCYSKPLEDFAPEGERFAREYLGCRGAYYPVGIGPLGMNTSAMEESNEHGQLFNGQKTNASYAAVVMAMRWYGTYDTEFARLHAYPFMRKAADFWEDYLVFENGRYMDYNDAAHEVWYYSGVDYIPQRHDDVNPLLAMGLIRRLFQCLIDMSEELNVDECRRAKWHHILDHISPFATMEKDGKTIFRLTEKGHEWVDGNTLDIQHIYPCSQIGMDSDKKLVETARNSLFTPERWEDSNGCSSYYPCAVRMGIDPDYIIEKLRKNILNHSLPNALFDFFGGGIENASVVPSTVNEMLMQSFEGVIRLFPNWNRENNVSFYGLRADGAFVVSATLDAGNIIADIVSEKGRNLTFENPYSDRTCVLDYGNAKITLSPGERVTLGTTAGMIINIS